MRRRTLSRVLAENPPPYVGGYGRTALRLLLQLSVAAVFTGQVSAAPPVLIGPTVLQGEFRFLLSGESNVTYTIESSSNLLSWSALELNNSASAVRVIAIPATNPAAFFRARVSQPLFANALTVKSTIDLSGNNLRTDSFDSSDPNFSTGGNYDALKLKDHGDIAAYEGILNSLNVGNVEVFGHIRTGPGAPVFLGPNGSVGDLTWHQGAHNGVEPGYLTRDMNFGFPDVEIPFSGGALTPAAGSIGGTNYAYVLADGNYRLSTLAMSGGTMMVTGDAALHIVSDFVLNGTARIVVAAGASLRMYVAGTGAIGGYGIINNNDASHFTYYGLPTSTSLTHSGNGTLIGCIYAPNADVFMQGGGNNIYDFSGAIVARTLKMTGHYQFHFDENLATIGPLF